MMLIKFVWPYLHEDRVSVKNASRQAYFLGINKKIKGKMKGRNIDNEFGSGSFTFFRCVVRNVVKAAQKANEKPWPSSSFLFDSRRLKNRENLGCCYL